MPTATPSALFSAEFNGAAAAQKPQGDQNLCQQPCTANLRSPREIFPVGSAYPAATLLRRYCEELGEVLAGHPGHRTKYHWLICGQLLQHFITTSAVNIQVFRKYMRWPPPS
jgi:hypothetical protein